MDSRIDYYGQHLEKVNNLCEEGDISTAWDTCKEVAKQARREGDKAFANFFEAEALALDGDLKRAARLQEKSVQEIGLVPYALGNCAVIMSMAGKPHKAVEYLDEVLNLNNGNLQALGQKGVSLAKMGYDEEALDCFEKILELDPGQNHALRNKAVSLSRLGKEDEALAIFDQVLLENPTDKHARSERSILLDEMNLRGTPLGWLLLWVRKRLAPSLLRIRYRREPAEPSA